MNKIELKKIYTLNGIKPALYNGDNGQDAPFTVKAFIGITAKNKFFVGYSLNGTKFVMAQESAQIGTWTHKDVLLTRSTIEKTFERFINSFVSFDALKIVSVRDRLKSDKVITWIYYIPQF